MPATSLPGVNGRGGFTWYSPRTIRPSGKFTPAACISIRISPAPGVGSGRSSRVSVSMGPNALQTIAFTVAPWRAALLAGRRWFRGGP